MVDLGTGSMTAGSPGCRGCVSGVVVVGFVVTPAHPASNISHIKTKNQANLFFN
jgi:hypothetical protein